MTLAPFGQCWSRCLRNGHLGVFLTLNLFEESRKSCIFAGAWQHVFVQERFPLTGNLYSSNLFQETPCVVLDMRNLYRLNSMSKAWTPFVMTYEVAHLKQKYTHKVW